MNIYSIFSLDTEKKKITDNENEVDGEIPQEEEEDMDEDEVENRKFIFKRISFSVLSRQLIILIHILIQVIEMMMIWMMMEVMVEIKFPSFFVICLIKTKENPEIIRFVIHSLDSRFLLMHITINELKD
jgi:hypothetical protein